eukprot:c26259_g1_i1.p1 GENE.c26259_g1_i1~~c26259_g1_i1.p1  ORF type:complete len:319 (+),score=29.49 c26259_g1_i1:159-1115(+)
MDGELNPGQIEMQNLFRQSANAVASLYKRSLSLNNAAYWHGYHAALSLFHDFVAMKQAQTMFTCDECPPSIAADSLVEYLRGEEERALRLGREAAGSDDPASLPQTPAEPPRGSRNRHGAASAAAAAAAATAPDPSSIPRYRFPPIAPSVAPLTAAAAEPLVTRNPPPPASVAAATASVGAAAASVRFDFGPPAALHPHVPQLSVFNVRTTPPSHGMGAFLPSSDPTSMHAMAMALDAVSAGVGSSDGSSGGDSAAAIAGGRAEVYEETGSLGELDSLGELVRLSRKRSFEADEGDVTGRAFTKRFHPLLASTAHPFS